jgi:succinoglycan biosynthesis transport protein ExoP
MAKDFELVSARCTRRSTTPRDLAAIFFRNKELLVTSFLAVFAVGFVYAACFPSYRAEMKVVVRRGRMDPALAPVPSVSPVVDREQISDEEMNSESDLLQDSDLLRTVVVDTGLAGRRSWWGSWLGQTAESRTEHAVRRLAAKLQVQPVRKSRLITVSYRASEPVLASAVLQSLGRAFLAKQTEIQRPAGQQAFFEAQMRESRVALDDAQQRMLDFTRRNRVAVASLQRDLVLQKSSEAEVSEMAVKAAVIEDIERAKALEISLHSLPERQVTQIRNTDNPQLQEKLQSKLLELQLRRTELLAKFQPGYRLVQEVDEQIAQAKSAIDAEEVKPLRDELTERGPEYQWARAEELKNQVELKGLEKKLAALHSQAAQYRDAAQSLGESAITQDVLEQQLQAAREKYLMYANKREEARIGDALDQGQILDVAIAEHPHVPALPTRSLWTAACLSLLGGCVFSAGIVFAADYFDSSFREPQDLARYLGTPVLGFLPETSNQPDRAGEEA